MQYSRGICGQCRQLVWLCQEGAGQRPAGAEAAAAPTAAPEPPRCRRCKLGLSEELQTCGVCLELVTDPFRFTSVNNESWENRRCGHVFCRGCLRAYASSMLQDGVWNIRCPGERCPYLLIERDLTKVFASVPVPTEGAAGHEASGASLATSQAEGAALLGRFRALRAERHGAHLLAVLWEQADAPEHEAGDAGANTGADEAPAAAAGVDDKPAVAGEARTPPERGFEAWALESCQACPTCLVIVRKETGCDHIQCRCGASFCYGCGAPLATPGSCICGTGPRRGPRLACWLRAQGKLEQL
mmetsp:Transcript_144531/g.448787  ORF Transcript_144531/g.448787 Transcript_144531/m.448787 type:complete len:301 (+) Transcript_144531:56-958(+)